MTLTGELRTCGHDKKYHRKQLDSRKQISYPCVHAIGFHFCECKNYKASSAQAQQGDEMSKKGNGTPKAKKQKSEGRKPTLAPFVDGPFKIYANTDGKEYEAMVLSSGIIKMEEKEYTSPSSAGSVLLGKDKKGKPKQVDGWSFWKFNKNGERVPLDALRGSKSPLTVHEPKENKPRKVRAKKVKASPAVEATASATA
jgi:hypothetical protein